MPPALLAVPVLITLHNAEEAATTRAGLRLVATHLHSIAGQLPSPAEVHAALTVATVVPWLVWTAVRRSDGRPLFLGALLLIQSLMLANVFWHVAAALVAGGYAPGVVTALAFNLPFSLYLLRRTWTERWLPRSHLAALLLTAFALHAIPAAMMIRILTSHDVP